MAGAGTGVAQQVRPAQQSQQAQQPNIFNTASQGINQGIKAAGMETMYQPGTIAGTDLTQYTNPYETQVVQNTLGDLDRQRQIEANQLAAQATARGAFGGSRDALMQSELSRNYGQQAANTSAQLRQAGFQNAQQMAGQDIDYGLAGSQNRINAASNLGQLSNLGFGMGTTLQDQSMRQGALEQGIKTAGMETMYQPGTIAGTDLTQYTNPYETQVVQNTLGDLDRQRQIEANQLAAQASARGAFGGSRDALMQSELSRNYGQQAANTSAQLRQAGFQNAQQMAGQDIGYGLTGSQNRQQAASTLGNLSNLGFGMGTTLQNQSMQQGALEQGINQLILDAAKQQYAGYTGAPATSLGYMNAAMGVTPTPTTTTQTKNPGLFDYLTLGAQTAGSYFGR